MLNYFVTMMPNASWRTLVGGLYYQEEQLALMKATSYVQRQPGINVGFLNQSGTHHMG